MSELALRLILGLVLYGEIRGENCRTRDLCSCVLDDGGVIDLTPIGNTDQTPMFLDFLAGDNYFYSYNPCQPFTEGSCQNAAGCQISNDRFLQYLIGDASTASFSHDGINPHVLYTAPGQDGIGTRNLDVELQCDPGAFSPSFFALGELGSQQYYFLVTSRCACKNVCGSPAKVKSGGLSAGSVLLIIAVVTVCVYFAGGVVYMIFVKKASGTQAIPNRNFWQSLPGLIKDGFQFTFGSCKSKLGYSSV